MKIHVIILSCVRVNGTGPLSWLRQVPICNHFKERKNGRWHFMAVPSTAENNMTVALHDGATCAEKKRK